MSISGKSGASVGNHIYIAVSALAIFLYLIVGCATRPEFTLTDVATSFKPSEVVDSDENYLGKKVLWGGVIINSTNIESGTQFELLAYPLDTNYKPVTAKPTEGRFIAVTKQYLETLDYAQGKYLSVIGAVQAIKQGKIGDANYTYPVIDIEQHHLWSEKDTNGVDTRVHFGIGVIFH